MKIHNNGGEVIYEDESPTIKETVEAAVDQKVSLRYANLYDANLRSANLRNADLRNANLRNVNLYKAELTNVDLSGSDLTKAKLCFAKLRGAILTKADLNYSDFYNAGLAGAILPEKTFVFTDFWTVLIHRERIKIECQEHSVEEWLSFTDEQIAAMHSLALPWWVRNKPIIYGICKSFGWVKRKG